jgi:MFS family permease
MPIVLVTAIGFLGAAGGTCLAPFIVDYVTTRGIAADAAGLLLSLGAAAGIAARLAAGTVADFLGFWPLSIIAALLGSGGVGIAMLAIGVSGPLLLPAVVLAFSGAWGWPGLLPLALTRASPGVFRDGVGMIVMGPLAGAVAGPSLFGLVVEHTGYPRGWTMLLLFVATASVLAIGVRRRSAVLHPQPDAWRS